MTTSTRLKACLYSFTSPGGPMYPTRIVRHAAWEALDFLFPVSYSLMPLSTQMNQQIFIRNYIDIIFQTLQMHYYFGFVCLVPCNYLLLEHDYGLFQKSLASVLKQLTVIISTKRKMNSQRSSATKKLDCSWSSQLIRTCSNIIRLITFFIFEILLFNRNINLGNLVRTFMLLISGLLNLTSFHLFSNVYGGFVVTLILECRLDGILDISLAYSSDCYIHGTGLRLVGTS